MTGDKFANIYSHSISLLNFESYWDNFLANYINWSLKQYLHTNQKSKQLNHVVFTGSNIVKPRHCFSMNLNQYFSSQDVKGCIDFGPDIKLKKPAIVTWG